MLAPLLALATLSPITNPTAQNQAQPPSGYNDPVLVHRTSASARIGAKEVPLAFPSAPRPYPVFSVDHQGTLVHLEQIDQTTIGQIRLDPEDPDAFKPLAKTPATQPEPTPGTEPPRLRVHIVTDALLNRNPQAPAPTQIVQPRRSALSIVNIEQIELALAQFLALAQASGLPRPRLDVALDTSPLFLTETDNQPALDQTALQDLLADSFNQVAFQGDDPTYRGPYQAVFVIHPALESVTLLTNVKSTPVASVPFWNFSPHNPTASLAPKLLDLYLDILAIDPASSTENAPGTTSALQPRAALHHPTPNLAAPGLLPLLPALATIPVQDNLLPIALPEDAILAIRNVAGTNTLLVQPQAYPLVHQRDNLANPRKVRLSDGSLAIAFDLSPSETDARAFLGGTTPRPAPQTPFPLPQPTEWAVSVTQETQDRQTVTATQTSLHHRGSAILAHSKNDPLARAGDPRHITLTVQVPTPDSLALNFHDALGRVVASVVLAGEATLQSPTPTNIARVPLGQEASVRVPLDFLPADAYTITLGPTPAARLHSRLVGGPRTIVIKNLAFADPNGSRQDNPPVPTPAENLLASLANTDDESAWPTLAEALAAPDSALRQTALAVLAARPDPRAIPTLTAIAREANDAQAAAAIVALAKTETPEAQTAIDQTLRHGPFDLNRLLVLPYISQNLTAEFIPTATLLLTSREPRLRAGITALLARVPGERAQFLLLTSLQDPDPRVRANTARVLDPTNDLFARRLLFQAVNDPLEGPRAAAAVRLLASPDPARQAEAANAVRDESPFVRAAVLQAIAKALDQNPTEDFREPLRLAVLATDAPTLTLTLQAFAKIPGPVVWDEIRTVANNPDPRVHAALIDLAKAKNISLPESVRNLLQNSSNPQIRQKAQSLPPS